MIGDRSIDFIDAFNKKGPLSAFAQKVKDEDELELCFRGNDDAVNIYYNNLLVWKIYRRSTGFKVEVSLHKSISPDIRNNIAEALNDKSFTVFNEKGETKRYPWIKKTFYDVKFVEDTYKILLPMIESYFEGDRHREKKRQQELFNYLDDDKKRFYVYDLELQQKGVNKKGQNLSDMIAVRYDKDVPKSLTLIEVKSEKKACSDKDCGIISHINGMYNFIINGKMQGMEKEAYEIIKQYKQLDIRKTPRDIESIKSIKKYEMIFILTDSAITYYENPGRKDEIKKALKEKIKCDFYKWEDNRLELIHEI